MAFQIKRLDDGDTLLTPEQIANEFATAYDSYAKGGTLLGADLTQGGTLSLLQAGFVTDNTSATIDRFAQAICDYWVSNNATGTPAHGGTSVQSVTIVPDVPAMRSAIQSLVTDQERVDPYRFFMATQEAVVNTFVCTIVELLPPNHTPTPLTETIS